MLIRIRIECFVRDSAGIFFKFCKILAKLYFRGLDDNPTALHHVNCNLLMNTLTQASVSAHMGTHFVA